MCAPLTNSTPTQTFNSGSKPRYLTKIHKTRGKYVFDWDNIFLCLSTSVGLEISVSEKGKKCQYLKHNAAIKASMSDHFTDNGRFKCQ